MPVKVVRPPAEADTERYVDALVNELKLNDPNIGASDRPLIVEQYLPRNENLHIVVIWDAWANLDRETRGGVILEAYDRARGTEFMRRISIAMGLTRQDAMNIGIDPSTGNEIGVAA
jgi:hypothetical protein